LGNALLVSDKQFTLGRFFGGSMTMPDDRDDWFPDSMPVRPPVKAATASVLTWTRQTMFLKDDQPDGAHYLLLRDTVSGGQPTMWQFWTLSEKLGTPEQIKDAAFVADKPGTAVLTARQLPAGNRYTALGQFGVDVEYYIAAPTATPRSTMRFGGTTGHQVAEHQDLLHLQLPGDGVYFVALFPRDRSEAAPTFATLGEGTVIKVTGEFGTDYNFLAGASHKTTAEDATFNGTAASVQDRKTGLVLALADKGSVQYQAYGLAASVPANLRVAPETLTLTLMADHAATEVTIKAPNGWVLGQETRDLALREKDGVYRLTIPAEVTSVKLVQK
jgi:hypothetical protein